MKQLSVILLNLLLVLTLNAQQTTSWRGENAEANYPAPSLLNTWPENGPEVLWHFEGLGEGFSSPVFANGKIYCTGMTDQLGYLYIISPKGTLEKKLNYGKEFEVSYPGSRTAVTIVDQLAYITTGYGELICFNLETEKAMWKKELARDFGSEHLRWGFNETVVVDGDHVYFTPGGKEFNLVALHRLTGDLIWKSAGKGETAAYCTPKLVSLQARKLLVTHTGKEVIAVDAKDGKLLWSYPHPNQYNIHPNTPIFQDQALYCFSGYGQGGVKLALNDNGTAVKKVWSTEKMDNQMGGAVLIDGYLYGSGHKSRGWFCLDWKTGDEKWHSSEVGNGVIIVAGGKLILYSEKGELALVNPVKDKFELISKAKVEYGSAQHWAHPAVHNGVLYVRHGNALVAYKISAS
ncbi:PQQ-binding-like beta-propeller repeat protein [Gaoshiqia sp. Z1-71]|uniref:outer membrane protein assembly factor BamB family protein n=1 Tax=Gaoshiqia hydrogeniformans TaxID=3290090 RepID=UPI003BF7BA2E